MSLVERKLSVIETGDSINGEGIATSPGLAFYPGASLRFKPFYVVAPLKQTAESEKRLRWDLKIAARKSCGNLTCQSSCDTTDYANVKLICDNSQCPLLEIVDISVNMQDNPIL